MIKFAWFSFFVFIIFACGKPLPVVENIDMQAWKSDEKGCQHIRTISIDVLKKQKQNFLGLSEMDIVNVFGKPDQNELYKRNQKFYYYFLQAGPSCKQPDADALRLVVRFNATGMAKEISIE